MKVLKKVTFTPALSRPVSRQNKKDPKVSSSRGVKHPIITLLNYILFSLPILNQFKFNVTALSDAA